MKAVPLVLVLLVASAGAQQESPKKHTPRHVTTTSAPVTQTEARSTFAKAENIIRSALNLPMKAPASGIADGTAPVSRAQVVAEMVRLYGVISPKVKLTPRPVSFEPSRLKIATAQRANLEKLIRMGAVAKLGPLATGPTDTLTIPQFGDALGFFLSRMAEITNQPSNKWTPALQPKDSQ